MGNNCCSEAREGKDTTSKQDIKNLGDAKKTKSDESAKSTKQEEMTPEELERSIQEKKDIVEKLKMQLLKEWENTESIKSKNQRNEEVGKLDSIEKATKEVPKIADLDTDNESPRRSPQHKKDKTPSIFDNFPISSAKEMDQFRVFAEHQMMSMKTQFAITYLMENVEFKLVIISLPKTLFKSWITGEPSFKFDNKLASRKKWRKQLGTEDLELIDNLGISFTDFVCDIYESTKKLYLPT